MKIKKTTVDIGMRLIIAYNSGRVVVRRGREYYALSYIRKTEHNRINARFSKKAFRRFANMTQLTVFSNNMEYNDTDVVPIEGVFYASTSYEKLFFNRFREESPSIHTAIPAIDDAKADFILEDTNLVSIKGTKEYNIKDPL